MREPNPSEEKINRPSESKSESSDEPLFVLKYRTEKVIKRSMVGLALLGLCGSGAFNPFEINFPHPLLTHVAGVIGLCIFGLFFLDTLLFREVRLYKDRIVKIWNFIGNSEVDLANARLIAFTDGATGVGRFKFGPYNKSKRFFHRRTKLALLHIGSPFMGVLYYEMLADQDDVKKLNTLLADLTGRKVEEFEQLINNIDISIQEGER